MLRATLVTRLCAAARQRGAPHLMLVCRTEALPANVTTMRDATFQRHFYGLQDLFHWLCNLTEAELQEPMETIAPSTVNENCDAVLDSLDVPTGNTCPEGIGVLLLPSASGSNA